MSISLLLPVHSYIAKLT